MANGSEGVAEFTIFRGGVADSIGGKQRKIQRPGDCDGSAVASFLFPMEMALQLDVHIAVSKQSDQFFNLPAGFFEAAMVQSRGQRPVRAASQADEAVGVFFYFF